MTAFGKFLGITAKTPEFVGQAVANFAEKGLGLLRPQSVSSTSVEVCACSECPVSGLRAQHLEGSPKVRKGPSLLGAVALSGQDAAIDLTAAVSPK